MKCMCAQTRSRFILSSERVLGNGARTEKHLCRRLIGGWNPGRCVTQDHEPHTIPTELVLPQGSVYKSPRQDGPRHWKSSCDLAVLGLFVSLRAALWVCWFVDFFARLFTFFRFLLITVLLALTCPLSCRCSLCLLTIRRPWTGGS